MTGRVAQGALTALAALAALAMAGCGGPGGSTRSAELAASPAAQDPSSTAPAPSPAVTAADGSDPEACSDGNCEIAVSAPVTIHFKIPDGPATLSLTKVGKNEVGYKVTSGDSRTSGEVSGDGRGCVTVFTRNSSNSSCGLAGKPPGRKKGAVVVQVVAGADGTAILRLISA
ncbi:hypothetical protein ETD85_23900 [Nonomuraea zeae]|uniref:Uncharacterized protein n=1 Tax=Nonomuraea zeae TaxID=1642303 RepID=A0A5S4GGX6_9ACTN|nr:hypothetical protein ETD85_23900 [Nonomuraea zeae]